VIKAEYDGQKGIIEKVAKREEDSKRKVIESREMEMVGCEVVGRGRGSLG
jgi:hypothetical protein